MAGVNACPFADPEARLAALGFEAGGLGFGDAGGGDLALLGSELGEHSDADNVGGEHAHGQGGQNGANQHNRRDKTTSHERTQPPGANACEQTDAIVAKEVLPRC